MLITRPYNAEDNNINIEALKILQHWALKNNEKILEARIYGGAVEIFTESGRNVYVSESQGCRSRYENVRSHLYMTEIKNNKRTRIKKEEW